MTSLYTAVSECCLGQFSEIILVPFGSGTFVSERTQVSYTWATNFVRSGEDTQSSEDTQSNEDTKV